MLTSKQAAAETYVQSMAAGVEQTRMLLAEYVDLQQSFEVDNSQAYSGPYVAVLLDGHNTYVGLCIFALGYSVVSQS